ncbi:PH domain-containing protein [Streptomyces sp. APSN-46.1]|uniref:PH domain-containing protein n=1 Tax=Streptomyces sp. APSN-46.1 TaxID=2929049 RepID=UPI001FB3E6C2|nr:PH domain-containing protein [Streptomyces sp. APSN-46.1]MCJ1681470.1 PH domain-containing protein [Streptomyces sp. APSN-46.1]
MAERALPREYRIKSGRTTRAVGLMSLFAIGALTQVWDMKSVPEWVKLLVSVLMPAFIGVFAVALRHRATFVDREGIRVRGLFRTRRLAWADVQDFEAEHVPDGARGGFMPEVLAYARTAEGRRVLLVHLDDVHVTVGREIAILRAVARATQN